MPNLFLDLPVPTSNADGAAVDVSSMGPTKTIAIGGTFDATVNIEFATDAAGTDWAPAVTFHAAGHQTVEVAAHWMRASTSAYKGGTPNAAIGSSGTGASFVQIPAPPLSGAGAPVSTINLPGFKTVVVGGPFTGSVIVEASEDGVKYFQVMTFYKGGGQSATFYGAYARARASGGDGSAARIWMGAADPAAAGDNGWPPFEQTTRRIFSRPTGSDLTGDGKTEATAYRTFVRGAEDLPNPTPIRGERVIFDFSDIGPEALPPDYALPALDAPFGLDFSSAFGLDAIYPFQIGTAIELVAIPKLVTGLSGANVLTPTELQAGSPGFPPGVFLDASTGLIEIHTNQNYGAADSLRGKLLQSYWGTCGVIWHNTGGADSIIYTSRASIFEEWLSPMFSSPAFYPFLPAPPFSIREQSAELIISNNPGDIIKPGFVIGGSGSIGMRGVKFTPAAPNPTGFSVQTYGSRTIFWENCDLFSFGAFHGTGCNIFLSSIIHGGSFASQVPICWISSMFADMAAINIGWSTPQVFLGLGFAIDNCPPMGVRLDALTPVGRGPMFDLQLRCGVIHGSVPDLNYGQIADPSNFPYPFAAAGAPPFFFPGLNSDLQTPGDGILLRGGKAMIDHVKIFGSARDAIHAEAGFGLIELKSVTGGEGGMVFTDLANTNGRYGVFMTDGTKALVIDQSPLQTGTGDDFPTKVGTTMTLTDAAGLFTPSMVGQTIAIAGSTTPANNNGAAFPITGYLSPTQITYINAAGVVEAFPGTWTVANPVPSTVTGTGANSALSIGDLPATDWATFRSGGKLLYDITAVGAGGATGTGTRIEEKP
jgi:hypothetical protein